MLATKVSVLPDIEIRCLTRDAIPHQRRYGYAVADIMGDLVHLGMGDAHSSQLRTAAGRTPLAAGAWVTPGPTKQPLTTLENVDFIRFLHDGTVQRGASVSDSGPLGAPVDYSGFVLQHTRTLRDAIVGSTSLSGAGSPLLFHPLAGSFESIMPADAPGAVALRNTGAELLSRIRTNDVIPERQSIGFDITGLGALGYSEQPAIRLGWSNDAWSIRIPHRAKPHLDEWVDDDWKIVKTIDRLPPVDLNGGRFAIRAYHIGGRMVIEINDYAFYLLRPKAASTAGSTPGGANLAWPEGHLTLNLYNVRATATPSFIDYNDDDGAPNIGRVIRRAELVTPIKESEIASPPAGLTAGWKTDDTGMTITSEIADNAVTYTATLTASPDGRFTPLLNRALIEFDTEFVEPSGTVSDLDVRKALKRLNIEHAMPPNATGSECRIELDRSILDQRYPGGTGYLDWRDYIGDRNPIEIRMRAKYSDGSRDADWSQVFRGYTWGLIRSTEGVRSNYLTLIGRDPIMRLQKPNNLIDYRDGPLDGKYANLTGDTPEVYKVWGSDLVHEVLRRKLGLATANELNGGYPTYKLRYFNDHYPLLSYPDGAGYFGAIAGLGQDVPFKHGFFFPPPYDEDPLYWINQIGELDYAVFCYKWLQQHSDPSRGQYWPSPVYGRLLNILAASGSGLITDREYLAGDLERLLLRASVESRPERQINRSVVYGPAAEGAEAFTPSHAIGEARVPDSFSNAPQYTWEVSDVLRTDLAIASPIAQAMARGVIDTVQGVNMQFPDVLLRGNFRWYWGDLATFRMDSVSSDLSLGLMGQYFRTERVLHTVDVETEDPTRRYTTGLYLGPRTNAA